MPNKSGKLFIFEAIELRNQYDANISILKDLLDQKITNNYGITLSHDEQDCEYRFDEKQMQIELKKLQTKRVILNQAIQVANLKTIIEYDNEEISLTNALEIKKNMFKELFYLKRLLFELGYKKTTHKEYRDVVYEPPESFDKKFSEYLEMLKNQKKLKNSIHIANHQNLVNFRDK